MRVAALILLVASCTRTDAPPPREPPQGQVVTEIGFVAMDPPPTVAPGAPGAGPGTPIEVIPPAKDQPPHVKLKLGHYINEARGIGVTIDLISARTDNIADIDPAKLRFDGDPKVYVLRGNQAMRDRIDFSEGRRLLLHVWDDGRRAVYVPDPDGGPSSDMIPLVRDADADPL